VKTQEARTELVIENYTLDRETISRFGVPLLGSSPCETDSRDEDWFRAEAELHHRLGRAAID